MPDKTACPRCSRIGFVRLEHVIKAGHAAVDYYCGFCEHTWSLDGEQKTVGPTYPKPRK